MLHPIFQSHTVGDKKKTLKYAKLAQKAYVAICIRVRILFNQFIFFLMYSK